MCLWVEVGWMSEQVVPWAGKHVVLETHLPIGKQYRFHRGQHRRAKVVAEVMSEPGNQKRPSPEGRCRCRWLLLTGTVGGKGGKLSGPFITEASNSRMSQHIACCCN